MTAITLYHGSQTEFTSFLIDPKFTRHSILMEGYGIYMTEDIEFAKAYGDFVYKVDVPKSKISDFTNRDTIVSVITELSKALDISIADEIDLETLIQSALSGDISITNLNQEISNLLETNESFYMAHEHRITFEEDCLFEQLREKYNQLLEPVVKYYDKSFKANVYICIKDEKSLNPILL